MSDPTLSWRPGTALHVLVARARLRAAVRSFFERRGVLEVDTPVLARFGVTEPQIQSISVHLEALASTRLFLQTSPEYAMKRLLAAGSPDIYQMGPVFRDGESGRRHQPEFILIEWYRRGLTLAQIAGETCALVNELGETLGEAPRPVTQLRYREVFLAATGADPLSTETAGLAQLAGRMLGASMTARLARELETDHALCLDLLMSHRVIPSLAPNELTVITHYPACQAALARLNPDDPREAERFELFLHGMELANGYRELTDPSQQAARFAADRQRRARLGRPDMLPDPDLLAALAHGLPDCCGVALGFDRVMMALLGQEDILGVRPFGLSDRASST